MKKVIKWAGHLLVLTALYFLVRILTESYKNLAEVDFVWYSYLILTMMTPLSLLAYYISSFSWHLQLKENYPKFKTSTAFEIISLSQIAKYIPGNIGHYVGRYFLSLKYINKADTLYSLMVENILFVLAYSFIGLFYLLFAPVGEWIEHEKIYWALLVITLSFSIFYFANKKIKQKIVTIRTSHFLLVKMLILFLFKVMLGGIGIYAIFYLLTPNHTHPFILLTSAFALSFLLGFIIPGAPGGIGIREYAFTVLLTPFTEQVIALQAILIFRVLSIINDLILYLIGKFILTKTENN